MLAHVATCTVAMAAIAEKVVLCPVFLIFVDLLSYHFRPVTFSALLSAHL